MKEEEVGEMMRAALYARVSTSGKGQDTELQLVPLREYCKARGFSIVEEYVDIGISGAKDRRPQLDRLMDAARKRQIDLIVVWKLDRFGRSLKQLVMTLEELSSLGIGFMSYQDNLDFSTAQGRLMFHIIGSMAEFERELIRERVKAGLDNARRKGKTLGRKPVPPIDRAKIISAHLACPNLSISRLSKVTGMKAATVYKTLSFYKAGLLDREGFVTA